MKSHELELYALCTAEITIGMILEKMLLPFQYEIMCSQDKYMHTQEIGRDNDTGAT